MFTKQNISIAVMAIFICTCFYFAGRNARQPIPVEDKYKRQYDSIEVANKALEKTKQAHADTAARLKKAFVLLVDSLKSNHKKVNNEKIKIKGFTPDARNAWTDSVLKRAGLR